MNEIQRKKRNFRASKPWKTFRHNKYVEQSGMDPITLRKLRKGCNCHHLKVTNDEDEYRDMSHPDHFMVLNNATHDCVHFLFPYYRQDKKIIERLTECLERMVELSEREEE